MLPPFFDTGSPIVRWFDLLHDTGRASYAVSINSVRKFQRIKFNLFSEGEMMIIVSRGIRDAISFSVYFLQTVIRRISITWIEKVILIENRNIVPVDEIEDSITLYNIYIHKKKSRKFFHKDSSNIFSTEERRNFKFHSRWHAMINFFQDRCIRFNYPINLNHNLRKAFNRFNRF